MSATDARLLALEEQLIEVRVQARALQLAILGKTWMGTGYYWAVREAEEEERARKRAEAEQAIANVVVSLDSVFEAAAKALVLSLGEAVSARDVTVALSPAAADPHMPGRQLLIARVGKTMRELVESGQLLRVSEPDPAKRKTGRYAVRDAAAAA